MRGSGSAASDKSTPNFATTVSISLCETAGLDEYASLRASEDTKLPADIDYASISGLSKEIQGKLGKTRPETLGQAGRIPGVTPAAISLLLIHLKKRNTGQTLEASA